MTISIRLQGYILRDDKYIFAEDYIEKILIGRVSVKGLNERGQLLLCEQMAHYMLENNTISAQMELYIHNFLIHIEAASFRISSEISSLMNALMQTPLKQMLENNKDWHRVHSNIARGLAQIKLMEQILRANEEGN